jgi:hypothetical protein
LPSVKRFVLFYGGDVSPEFARAVFNTEVGKEQHDDCSPDRLARPSALRPAVGAS